MLTLIPGVVITGLLQAHQTFFTVVLCNINLMELNQIKCLTYVFETFLWHTLTDHTVTHL